MSPVVCEPRGKKQARGGQICLIVLPLAPRPSTLFPTAGALWDSQISTALPIARRPSDNAIPIGLLKPQKCVLTVPLSARKSTGLPA